MHINAALQHIKEHLASSSDTASLESQVLLASITGRKRSWILAHPEEILTKSQIITLENKISRLEKGEPLPYLIGHWEFYGLDFDINPNVLIPRPETEILVEYAIKWLHSNQNKHSAADVGTGSGCIATSIAVNAPGVNFISTDISLKALLVARLNAEKLNVLSNIKFLQSNLLHGVNHKFDLICANLPYISNDVLKSLMVHRFEPAIALNGGSKGLEVIYQFLSSILDKLNPHGLLLIEIDSQQSVSIKSYTQNIFPCSKVEILQDYSGQDRIVAIHRS